MFLDAGTDVWAGFYTPVIWRFNRWSYQSLGASVRARASCARRAIYCLPLGIDRSYLWGSRLKFRPLNHQPIDFRPSFGRRSASCAAALNLPPRSALHSPIKIRLVRNLLWKGRYIHWGEDCDLRAIGERIFSFLWLISHWKNDSWIPCATSSKLSSLAKLFPIQADQLFKARGSVEW